jgi:hypothetical protein
MFHRGVAAEALEDGASAGLATSAAISSARISRTS